MTIWTLYGSLSIVWLWLAYYQEVSWYTMTYTFLSGLFIWSFLEYAIHRWIMHRDWEHPLSNRTTRWHLAHHHHPEDVIHLQWPIRFTMIGYIGLYLAAYLITGNKILAGICIAGACTGYLLFEYIHHMVHFATPTSKFARARRRYHLIHHYAEPERAFGVTSPVWDFIFRTRPIHRAPVVSLAKHKHLLTHH